MNGKGVWLVGGLLGCLLLGTPAWSQEKPKAGNKDPFPSLARQELAAIAGELLGTRSELRKRKVELGVMKERADRDAVAGKLEVTEQVLLEALSRDPESAVLLARLQEVDREIARMKSVSASGAADKRLRVLEDSRSELTKGLSERRKDLAQRMAKLASVAAGDRIRDAEDRIKYLTQLEQTLKSDAAALQEQLSKAGGTEEERVERLEGEVRKLRSTVRELMDLLSKK